MAQPTPPKKLRARTLLGTLTLTATLLGTAHVADAAPATIQDNAEINTEPRFSRANRTGATTSAAPAPEPTRSPAPIDVPANGDTGITPARINVPTVGLNMAIFRGGQATIDQGVATWYDDGPGGFPEPTNAGAVGTLWLTGHRTQAGGPFGPVVNIPIGAHVHVTGHDGTVVTYRINNRTVVNAADVMTSFFAVFGRDSSERAITLQTSLPNNHRLIVRGELI